MKLTLCLSLLLSSVLFGQTVTSGGYSTGLIMTSGGSSSGLMTSTDTLSNAVILTPGGTGSWIVASTELESRKATGPMPTIAQVRHAAYHLGGSIVPANYIVLAREVGAAASAEEAQIDQAIHDLNLNVYPFDKVDNYLYRTALKQGTNVRWVWKPAREKDQATIGNNSLGFSSRGATAAGLVSATLYAQAIPVTVLAEMKALMETVPDAMFLVSDYEVQKPDPFLAVTTKNLLSAGKIWIVEAWSEPGFGSAGDEASTVAQYSDHGINKDAWAVQHVR